MVAAGRDTTAVARQALETLFVAYWRPLYFFLRRRGRSVEDAEDLIQGFFAHLLGQGVFQQVQPGLGKFRSFLLAALENFVAKERRKQGALKRGGGATVLSLDVVAAERRYCLEASDNLSADKLYLREWTATIVSQAMSRLEEMYAEREQVALFRRLQGRLAGDHESPSYRTIAQELGMTEGAVKVAVGRMRRRLGDCLRLEIGQTVTEEDDIDEEIRLLLSSSD